MLAEWTMLPVERTRIVMLCHVRVGIDAFGNSRNRTDVCYEARHVLLARRGRDRRRQ